ncbi:hypothetical protein TorRG33x02_356900, partial [Trema orientale]
ASFRNVDRRHESCEEVVMYMKGKALEDAVVAIFIVSLDGFDKMFDVEIRTR